MSTSLKTIIVEKTGVLKESSIKELKIENLYKKCGFKTIDNFQNNIEWKVKIENVIYYINVYGKTSGKANCENKYDFPPPIDNTLFFGNCIIIASVKSDKGIKEYVDLSLKLWNSIYEKLFGGFEDLSATIKEDEEEVDELEQVPKEKKTKDGYLKDGFVVDSSDSDNLDITEDDDDNLNDDIDDTTDDNNVDDEDDNNESTELDDVGSELSEEPYIDEE